MRLTFWSAGLRNVTASLGLDGFTDEHLEALKAFTIRRVLVAYRHTEAGDRAAEKVSERLVAAGHEVFRLRFPLGLDANDYALREGPERLAELVRRAEWQDAGGAPSAEEPPTAAAPVAPVASPMPAAGPAPIDAEVTDTDVVMTFDDRRYRARGLEKNHSLERMKVNLLVSRDGLMHVDTLDLYASRARSYFIKQAATELYTEEETVKRDLARVLLKLEALQEEQIRRRLTVTEPKPVELTDQERHEALQLLKAPNLLERILEDYDRCGLVGEETNKEALYLACVSRRLENPLAVMIQSSSGTGKTSLLSATLALMPTEDQIQYSALTGQALYYMGRTALKHKILAVAEEAGVAEASYALKLLQSDGVLRIASAGKDTETGRNQTQEYEVEGPVVALLATTAESPDPELQNRCLTLRVNEDLAQTRQLLVLVDDYVGQRSQREDKSRLELRFTQRELREALGWGDFQLRRHLVRLIELEYVLVHRTKRGNQREYELLYDGQGRDGEPFVLGLIDVAKLRQAKYDNRNDHLARRNDAHPMPIRSAFDAHSMAPKYAASASGNGQLGRPSPKPSGNGQDPPHKLSAS